MDMDMDMDMDIQVQPIFMIGTQRSGSNLLRLMLNQLDEIASPHPPHILKRMYPLLDYYNDITRLHNFHQLADDVCRLVELNPVPWEGVILNRDEVISRCKNRSLLALFGAVYDICAETWGARTWCCKSLENIKFVDDIERYFDSPRYIYLYRDGRDVALSFQKAVVGEKHMYNIAANWANTQSIALKLRDRFEESRFFSVSYENLIENTEHTAQRLCKFLGVEYNCSMLDYHRSKEASRSAESSSLWSGLVQPVIKSNTQKYLHSASQEEIVIFESVAGHVLDNLGYQRAYVMQGEEKRFSETETALFNTENDRLKQDIISKIDKEDMERRDLQASHLDSIKLRHAPFENNQSYNRNDA
jgi:hypothetical protein